MLKGLLSLPTEHASGRLNEACDVKSLLQAPTEDAAQSANIFLISLPGLRERASGNSVDAGGGSEPLHVSSSARILLPRAQSAALSDFVLPPFVVSPATGKQTFVQPFTMLETTWERFKTVRNATGRMQSDYTLAPTPAEADLDAMAEANIEPTCHPQVQCVVRPEMPARTLTRARTHTHETHIRTRTRTHPGALRHESRPDIQSRDAGTQGKS